MSDPLPPRFVAVVPDFGRALIAKGGDRWRSVHVSRDGRTLLLCRGGLERAVGEERVWTLGHWARGPLLHLSPVQCEGEHPGPSTSLAALPRRSVQVVTSPQGLDLGGRRRLRVSPPAAPPEGPS